MDGLREHIQRVGQYEDARAAEKRRIVERDSERLVELDARAYTPTPEDGEIHQRLVRDLQALYQKWDIVNSQATELQAWERKNRPDVSPLDTPARLARWIDNSLLWLTTRRGELLRMTPLGQAVLDAEGFDVTDRRMRELYIEARGRALAFSAMIPDVLERLPEALHSHIGLQSIHAWCDAASSQWPAKTGQRLWKGQALQLVSENPGLSVTEIARQIGVNKGTLSRCRVFQSARKAGRRDIPRGSKSADGRLEAEDE